MDDIKLSRQAENALAALYKRYRSRIDANVDPFIATVFGTVADIQRDALPNWAIADIETSCWELDEAGLLNCVYGDDTIQTAILNPNGINHAGSRFRRTVSKLIDFAEKIRRFWQ